MRLRRSLTSGNEVAPSFRRRKNNSPSAVPPYASPYFAEQAFKRLSEMLSDREDTSAPKEETPEMIYPPINPLISSHKDSRGRRRGVSQRTQLDIVVLNQLKDGLH